MADKKPVGVVKYTRAPSTREITRADWERAGVKNQPTIVWDRSNHWAVPVEKLNKAALAVLAGEEGFRVDEDATPSGN